MRVSPGRLGLGSIGSSALICLLTLGSWGCGAGVHEDPIRGATPTAAAILQPADTSLLKAAHAVVRVAPRIEQVWPGFWPPEQAFILYRPGDAVLLVSPAAPPAGFRPLRGPMVPEELRGRAYLYRGTLAGLDGSYFIDFPAGGATATAVALDPEGDRHTLTTLFHEAFHGYQRRRFAAVPTSAGEFVDPAQIAAPEFRALVEVERRMLAGALMLPVGSLPEHLREYLAVRWMRSYSVPGEVLAVERQLERLEGSAELVGLEAGLLVSGRDGEQILESLRTQLTHSLDGVSGGLSERLIRWRVYGTGASIGLLLDRLGSEWRLEMEGGATFDELLAAAVGFDAAAAPALAVQALDRHGFVDLLAEATAAAAGAEIRSVDDFLALAPARLVVEFEVPIEDGRAPLRIHFDAGGGGFVQLQSELLAIPDPQVYTLQVPQASLLVRGRPVLQDVSSMVQERLRITVLLPKLPTVEGGRPLPEGEHHRERLDIEAEGVQLTLEGPVTVQVSSDTWIIRAAAVQQQQPQ